MTNHLHVIGIMTGNSLDGADLVLSRCGRDDGEITDLHAYSVPFRPELQDALRAVRIAVNAAQGRMEEAIGAMGETVFDRTLQQYTATLVDAVEALRSQVPEIPIDLIGLHGQTCAHRPRSIAGEHAGTFTVQIGDGQALANRTGITVVLDFRSDDLMAGGEGAPLAPVHHRHLAESAQVRGIWPLAFANGGNTGNISVISANRTSGQPAVLGWDTGPFNHFPDRLMQLQGGQPCDWDGMVGRRGSIDLALLGILFHRAVVTGQGSNFLWQAPPKSSDPEWYHLVPELMGTAPLAGRVVAFEDRVRTATYFASYAFVHSLSLLPPEVKPPTHLAVCGGGWRNPLCLTDFRNLLAGDDRNAPILPEHMTTYARLRTWTAQAVVEPSNVWGFDGTAMEARIFADAAVCRIKGEPFTLPATTGVRVPTVCGVITYPGGISERASASVRAWIDHFGTGKAPLHPQSMSNQRWSRASAGWSSASSENLTDRS